MESSSPSLWLRRKELVMCSAIRKRLQIVELLALTSAAWCGAACLADVIPNMKCLPTTLPVSGCGCPNAVQEDVCQGVLPKTGNMYGEVACSAALPPNTCDNTQNQNACGIVYKCAGVVCGSTAPPGPGNPYPYGIFWPSCEAHPEKSGCENKYWGKCVYTP